MKARWFWCTLVVAFMVICCSPAPADDWTFSVSVLPTAGGGVSAEDVTPPASELGGVEVVCFTSANCAPCKTWLAREKPIIENSGTTVRPVNGADPKYRQKWQVTDSNGKRFVVDPVTAYPTVMVMRDGVPIWRRTGYAAADVVLQKIPPSR